MNVAVLKPPSSAGHSLSAKGIDAERLAGVVLLRLAAASAPLSAQEIARDLHPLVAHKISAETWPGVLAGLLTALQATGCVAQAGTALSTTANGSAVAAKFLGLRKQARSSWPQLRDGALVVKALGLEKEPASRLKAIAKADGLRALIVVSAFQLEVRGSLSPSRLRAALAVMALGRAFGNQVKHELGEKPGLSAKSGRLLAGQLSQKPRDFRTDGRLVAALAAEAVGAQRSDLGALRLAALRRFVSIPSSSSAVQATPRKPKRKVETGSEASRQAPSAKGEPQLARVAVRPDPAGFARQVQTAARSIAEGWSGNRKAFISHVWTTLHERHPEWALTEIEFKCMLTEAHRAGLLALASADLKDKRHLPELQASAVSYKNTVWHYIRVED